MWNFKWLSLSDLQGLIKSEQDKGGNVSGTPKAPAPTPVVHTAQPTPAPTPTVNTQPPAQQPALTVPAPKKPKKPSAENPLTVPEHVDCPWGEFHGKQKNVPAIQDGQKDLFTHPQHQEFPLHVYNEQGQKVREKGQDEITWDDMASAIHHHRFLDNYQFNSLSDKDKAQHLKDHPLSHLTKDGEGFLKNALKRIAFPEYSKAVEHSGLTNLGIDPYDKDNALFGDFVDRIYNEFTPHMRLGYKQGYAKHDSDEYKNHAKETGKAFPGNYHSGLDTSTITDGKSFEKTLRNKINHWGMRFLNKEANTGLGVPGFDKLLGVEYDTVGDKKVPKNPITAHIVALREMRDTDKQLSAISKKHGMAAEGAPVIDKDSIDSYSVMDLADVFKKAKYSVEVHPDKLVISNPDDESSVPFEYNFKQPLSVLKQKALEEFKPTLDESSDFGKFIKLNKDVQEKKVQHADLLRKLNDTEQELNEFATPPSTFHKSSVEYASEAIGTGEKISQAMGHNPHGQKIIEVCNDALGKIVSAIPSVPEEMESNEGEWNPKQGAEILEGVKKQIKPLEQIIGHINGAKDASSADAVEAYKGQVKMLLEDLKKYAEKISDRNSGKFDQTYGNKLDALDDVREKYGKLNDELNSHNQQIMSLSNHPDVSEYLNLQKKKEQQKENLTFLSDVAKEAWGNAKSKFMSSDAKGSISGTKAGSQGDEAQTSMAEIAGSKQKAAQDALQNAKHSFFENVPDDIDFDKEEGTVTKYDEQGNETQHKVPLNEASKMLLDGYKATKAGDFLFGGEGNAKGLVHVADQSLRKLRKTGAFKEELEGLLDEWKKNREDGTTPEIFKNASQLKNGKWEQIYNMAKNPDVLAYYAMKFSDYSPHPLHADDFYPVHKIKHENPKTQKDLRNAMAEDHLHPDHSGEASDWHKEEIFPMLRLVRKLQEKNWRVVPDGQGGHTKELKHVKDPTYVPKGVTRQVFHNQYVKMFEALGNHIIERQMKKNPQLAEILGEIKKLNGPYNKATSKTSPGKLRQKLERLMDAHYGRMKGDFPDWPHQLKDTDRKNWLKQIQTDDEQDNDKMQKINEYMSKKSLVVPVEKELRKAVRLVIYDESD